VADPVVERPDPAAALLLVVDLAVERPDPAAALLLVADPTVEWPDPTVVLLLVAEPAVEQLDTAATLLLVADPAVKRPDPAAVLLLVADPASDTAAAHGWARWARPWIFLFCFFYFINRGGQANASVKARLTVTFCARWLQKPSRLSHSSRFG
jgi:hypothetical protein